MGKTKALVIVLMLLLLAGCTPTEPKKLDLSAWIDYRLFATASHVLNPYPSINVEPLSDEKLSYKLYASTSINDDFKLASITSQSIEYEPLMELTVHPDLLKYIRIETSEKLPSKYLSFSVAPNAFKIGVGKTMYFKVFGFEDDNKESEAVAVSQVLRFEYKEQLNMITPEKNEVLKYDPKGTITFKWSSPSDTQYEYIRVTVFDDSGKSPRIRLYESKPYQTSLDINLSDPFFHPGEYRWSVGGSIPKGAKPYITVVVASGSAENRFTLE